MCAIFIVSFKKAGNIEKVKNTINFALVYSFKIMPQPSNLVFAIAIYCTCGKLSLQGLVNYYYFSNDFRKLPTKTTYSC